MRTIGNHLQAVLCVAVACAALSAQAPVPGRVEEEKRAEQHAGDDERHPAHLSATPATGEGDVRSAGGCLRQGDLSSGLTAAPELRNATTAWRP